MSTDFKQLTAWQRGMDLVKEVYRCTRSFPREGRYSQKELIQFLYKARGPLMEWEIQICIARSLDYFDKSTSQYLSTKTLEVMRILNGLINHFQQKSAANGTAPVSGYR